MTNKCWHHQNIIFGQFLDVIGPHSQVKRHVTYIYFERTFYGYRILFTKHKKLFLFLTNKPLSNTLIFSDFCWCQQILEALWQQTIYQQTSFNRFYQMTKFHDQSIRQTGSMKYYKNAGIIKIVLFWSIFERGRTTQSSQKACILYIFRKNILLAIISFLQSTRSCFYFGEITF